MKLTEVKLKCYAHIHSKYQGSARNCCKENRVESFQNVSALPADKPSIIISFICSNNHQSYAHVTIFRFVTRPRSFIRNVPWRVRARPKCNIFGCTNPFRLSKRVFTRSNSKRITTGSHIQTRLNASKMQHFRASECVF